MNIRNIDPAEKPAQLGILLAISFVLIVAVSFILSVTTDFEFILWIQVFGSLGTLLLSGAVLLFYRKLVSLEDRQASIQQNQNTLMRYENKPVVEIRDRVEKPAKELFDFPDANSAFWDHAMGIQLKLENRGNGLAENLDVVIDGVVGIANNGFMSFFDAGIIVTANGLTRGSIPADTALMSGRTGSLAPGEVATFETAIAVVYDDKQEKTIPEVLATDHTPIPLGEALEHSNLEIDSVVIQMEIQYQYMGMFYDNEVFLRAEAQPAELSKIEDIFEVGKPISQQETEMITEYLNQIKS